MIEYIEPLQAFRNLNPRKGTETMDPIEYLDLDLTFRNLNPRKGTETIPKEGFSFFPMDFPQSKSPQGD